LSMMLSSCRILRLPAMPFSIPVLKPVQGQFLEQDQVIVAVAGESFFLFLQDLKSKSMEHALHHLFCVTDDLRKIMADSSNSSIGPMISSGLH